MLELLLDPAAWIGLLTLVVLEIVLGIDNLIFIAILTHKLPPEQRDRARVTGLSLAMFMRLALLSAISWLVTLTAPLFHVAGHGVSGRDLILFVGGLFLIYKATTELHERLEGGTESRGGAGEYASFFVVVAQIIVLDAVFSLDSVITAVGMVNQLPVMMAAVVISVGIMLVASKALTQFVNAHPTVVVLCLAFLLMIGLSLLADGLGFHIPKGYLYAAICFAILIEFLNQQGRRNRARQEARRPLRERTAESVLRLLGGRLQGGASVPAGTDAAAAGPEAAFAPEERQMVSGVLSLADRNVRSIMTPRPDIAWIDLDAEPAALRAALRATPHSLLPVGRGSLDGLLGVARVKDLLDALVEHGRLEADAAYLRAPLRLPATASVVQAMDQLRQGRGQLALVNNEYGVLLGLVTPLDVLEAIAGEFPDEGEALEIQDEGPGRWRVAGAADLLQFGQRLDLPGMADPDGLYTSVAGFLLSRFGHLPVAGETLDVSGYEFRVLEADEQRIRWVRVSRQPAPGGAPSPAAPAGRPAPPGPAAG